MTQNPPVKSVETAFDIVEFLVQQRRANLTTIATQLGLPKSTAHDHLTTLRQKGYVEKTDQEYTATLKFLELGGRIRDSRDVFEAAEAELQKVANDTGEHTSLMVEENDWGIYVYTAPGEHLQEIVVPIGTHTPLYASAPGKAILACMSEDRRRQLIEEYTLKQITENTITDPHELTAELEMITERGYALDNEEGKPGLQGIAKPIVSRDDEEVLGAICVYGPSGRANMEFLREEALKSLERAANVIEHDVSTHTSSLV